MEGNDSFQDPTSDGHLADSYYLQRTTLTGIRSEVRAQGRLCFGTDWLGWSECPCARIGLQVPRDNI